MKRTKRLIVENCFSFTSAHGWGNGYVAVPPGHPLWGKAYNDDDYPDMDVHGGVTLTEPVLLGECMAASKCKVHPEYVGKRQPLFDFAECLDGDIPDNWWLIGFDTCHADDSADVWPKDRVVEETTKLQEEIETLEQQSHE